MSRPTAPASPGSSPDRGRAVRPDERRRGEPRPERSATRGFRAFLEAQSDKALKLRDVGPETTSKAHSSPGHELPGAEKLAELGGREAREAREAFEPRARREPRDTPRDEEPRWSPPPPALLPPIERSAPTAPIAGTAQAAAEAAALAERVLSSLKVGRVAGMPEVRMRLDLGTRGLGSREGVEVRLRLDEGRVIPVLVTDRPAEAAQLAERLDTLFAERGIDAERVVIERG
ncbi:MAG: hypothetical protein MUE69_10805 [Myxococcota bacterium]|jgi:hypothetical protein|nr:hypothetical protein [Myxococcota bacterium]